MVLYHWLNYFVTTDWDIYRYLRFLTPSFILIAGFLVSHTYLSRQSADDPRFRRRLMARGGKLLLLFTVLNLAANLLLKQNYDGAPLGVRAFVAEAYDIYVLGTGRAAFD